MAGKGKIPTKGASSAFQNPDLVDKLVCGNTTFAVNMFKKLIEAKPSENVFFSPLSISTALAMTSVGSKENTAKEMKDVLSVSEVPDSDLHPTFNDLNAVLKSKGGESGYMLHAANRLFCRKDYTFLEEFLSSTRKHYNAEATSLDFAGNAEGSRHTINKWVEEQTVNKIKDIIPAGCIDALTTLILVNAIYFKGNWENKFDVENTKKEKFHVSKDETIDVDMMHLSKDLPFNMHRKLNFRIVELPYSGKDLSMFILLPEKADQLSTLEENLTPTVLQEALQPSRAIKVNLSLPKFRLEDEFSLKEKLSALGMQDIFTAGKADLSGMDGTKNLYVSTVLHKSFVEVNEEGTEAAAATAVKVNLRCMPMVMDFKADHPFLFLIRDNRSNSILFLGRMVRPPTA